MLFDFIKLSSFIVFQSMEKTDVRSMIKFLFKGLPLTQVKVELNDTLGETIISFTTVKTWI